MANFRYPDVITSPKGESRTQYAWTLGAIEVDTSVRRIVKTRFKECLSEAKRTDT